MLKNKIGLTAISNIEVTFMQIKGLTKKKEQ